MNYLQHFKIGIVCELIITFIIGILIYYFSLDFSFTWLVLMQFIIVILVSPLSPDLDHHNGKLREIWIGLGLLVGGYGVILDWFEYIGKTWMIKGILLALIPFSIPYFTTHRGIIHSILFNVIYGYILYFVTRDIYITVIGSVGFYSHLWADNERFKLI